MGCEPGQVGRRAPACGRVGGRRLVCSFAPVALEMRISCERCTRRLDADGEAFICSFECTFCAQCADELNSTCPNCGGELTRRPRRSAS